MSDDVDVEVVEDDAVATIEAELAVGGVTVTLTMSDDYVVGLFDSFEQNQNGTTEGLGLEVLAAIVRAAYEAAETETEDDE